MVDETPEDEMLPVLENAPKALVAYSVEIAILPVALSVPPIVIPRKPLIVRFLAVPSVVTEPVETTPIVPLALFV